MSRASEDPSRRDPREPRGPEATGQGGALTLQIREYPRPLLATCDVCGSGDLAEIRCKVICRNCRTILQSCADL